MSNIIRCRHCRTFVYDHASRCHGCGKPVRGGRLLGRGAFVFVALVTAAYGVGRGVDLIQEREWRAARYERETAEDARARAFIQAYFRGDEAGTWRWVGPADVRLTAGLRKFRELLPEVFPIDGAIEFGRERVTDVTIESHRLRDGTFEVRVAKPGIFSERPAVTWGNQKRSFPLRWEDFDGPEGLTATPESSAAWLRGPLTLTAESKGNGWHSGSYALTGADGLNHFNVTQWEERAREYEVFVTRDARRFRMLTSVSMRRDELSTFRIDRIEDAATGEVIFPAGS